MIAPLPGDFCCVPIHGDVGFLISVGEWLNGDGFARFDHAEVYTGQPDKAGPHGYTVSANPRGDGRHALPCPAADLPGALWSTGIIALTAAQRDAIVSWCLSHEHVPYSALDYFALAAHRLHIPLPGLRRFIARSDRMICSEYVAFAYQQAGVRLFRDRWDGYVTPAALADMLEASRSS